MDKPTNTLDALDRELIGAMRDTPRASITQLATQLGVARGTLYARLERLEADGVIVGYGPDLAPSESGYGVLGFSTLEISQGSHEATIRALRNVDEILEIHTITGVGDLLIRVVAQSNDHLHDVLQRIAAIPSIDRSHTQLALSSTPQRSLADLVRSPGVST